MLNDHPLPVLILDFDATIHGYSKGWQKGCIYDEPVPNFLEWASEAKKYFQLIIFSSRSTSHKEIQPMHDWLSVHIRAWHWEREDAGLDRLDLSIKDFEFVTHKPAAFISIDDRAVTFKGNWKAEELKPENLRKFKSWIEEERKQ